MDRQDGEGGSGPGSRAPTVPARTTGRLVVADPHRLVAEVLADALARAGHEIAGAVTSVADLLGVLAGGADSCVLHPGLPRGAAAAGDDGGVSVGDPRALVRAVRRAAPGCRLVLRSDRDDPRLRHAGAAAVVSGHWPLAALARAVAPVSRHGSAQHGSFRAERAGGGAPRRRPGGGRVGTTGVLHRLTAREQTVLALLATGASTDQVAGTLRIGRETVRSHVRSILLKLDARSRIAAVASVAEAGELDALLTSATPV